MREGIPLDATNDIRYVKNIYRPHMNKDGIQSILSVKTDEVRNPVVNFSVKVIAERLGHATPSLVMNTDGHVTDRMQKDATTAIEAALTS